MSLRKAESLLPEISKSKVSVKKPLKEKSYYCWISFFLNEMNDFELNENLDDGMRGVWPIFLEEELRVIDYYEPVLGLPDTIKAKLIGPIRENLVKTAIEIKLGLKKKLELGNLDSKRDWGHSKDYVRAMHLILNSISPEDWIVSTGETKSVRDLCEYVFSSLDMNYKDYVIQNKKFIRPEELKYLKGDSSKIRNQLHWKPDYNFQKLIDRFVLSKNFPQTGRAETIRLVRKSLNFELSSRFFDRLKLGLRFFEKNAKKYQ